MHNVQNALAAIAVGLEVRRRRTRRSRKALAEFKGVGRRFQRYGDVALDGGGSFTLIDDYGHHPAEMAATLAAARGALSRAGGWCSRSSRIATRARATCSRISCACCPRSTRCVLAEVYPAGEAPIVAADGRALARAVRVAGKVEPVFVEDVARPAAGDASRVARDGDVVVTMGAGSIGAACRGAAGSAAGDA